MLRINNVRVGLKEKNYANKIASVLNIKSRKIKNVRLVKQSIDARHKNNIHYVCSFEFTYPDEEGLLKSKQRFLSRVLEYQYPKLIPTKETIIVVGSGPAGLFCAYNLARSGQKVILIERGKTVDQRCRDVNLMRKGILDEESNVQFGEGGAGTFSDGKLTTGKKNFRKQFILETFIKYGATEDIAYLAKPHIGTDKLIAFVRAMRQDLLAIGVEIYFETKLIDLVIKDNCFQEAVVLKQGHEARIKGDKLVLAIGHSARDTYQMLSQYLNMTAKPFAVGLRIEHSQDFIDRRQYGKPAGDLGLKPADYKLAVATSSKRGVYSFCMCPGGRVLNSSSEQGHLVVNGMSNYLRDEIYANSAIVVTVNEQDFDFSHPLNGIAFQRNLEKKAYELGGGNFRVPVQRVEDYLRNSLDLKREVLQPTVWPGVKYTDSNSLFSPAVNQALHEGLVLMNQKMPGFTQQAVLSGVETRTSAPLRILRDSDYQANIQGIYPIGEGAGYAGGIMSSAIDGLKCSEMIVKVSFI